MNRKKIALWGVAFVVTGSMAMAQDKKWKWASISGTR